MFKTKKRKYEAKITTLVERNKFLIAQRDFYATQAATLSKENNRLQEKHRLLRSQVEELTARLSQTKEDYGYLLQAIKAVDQFELSTALIGIDEEAAMEEAEKDVKKKEDTNHVNG